MLRFGLCWLCVLAVSPVVFAQAVFPMDGASSSGRFVEPPRAALQKLRLAEEAIQQEQPTAAVLALGELLQRENLDDAIEIGGQDFFMETQINGNGAFLVKKTLMSEARRLLNQMPAKAFAQYELVYGPQAKSLLEEATKNRQWNQLSEVKRRYFHTAAGLEATELLLRQAIALGENSRSMRLAQSMREHPLLDDLQRKTLTSKIEQWNSRAGKAQTADKTMATSPRRAEAATDFRYYSGPTANGENSYGQLPLSGPRYLVNTTGNSRQERELRESVDTMSAVGELAPPSWLPLRVGNQLLMRTTERLVGVDFVSGKMVWQYPWFKTGEEVDAGATDMEQMSEDQTGNSLLKQRVWNDLPYGRMSSDGTRVYVLGDLGQMEMTAFSPMMGLQGIRPAERGANSLVALDLATEGKLVWQIGGGQLTESDALNGAFFLGPPLPIGDALYGMAELAGDITLLCLDAATGSLRWRQQLLAMETGGIDHDPVRRVAGASASYEGGLLVCVTGAGAIVAVDIDDRTLVWGAAVERSDAINQHIQSRRDGVHTDRLLQRWWDSTPLITDQAVFVTPIESDRLFAFDLLTGEQKWKVTRSQAPSRYLAGMHEGKLLLVGGDNVWAYDATTGKVVWKTIGGWLDAGERICGLGVFGTINNPANGKPEVTYFLPTSHQRIIGLSAVNGSALAHRTMSYSLGNLIAVDGQIISQSATALAVAYGQASLEPKVAEALISDPNNVEMMIRKAQLLMEQQQRSEAMKWLSKARKLQPDNIEIQQLSVNAMLGALREDFSANGHFLLELERLIVNQPSEQAALIRLQIRAALERNEPQSAIQRLIKLSSIAIEEGASLSNDNNEVEASRTVSRDDWIGSRVSESIEAADAESRPVIDNAIKEYLAKFSNTSTIVMQRLVQHFGSHAAAEPFVRSLLGRFAANRQWLAVERLVLTTATTTPDRLDNLQPWQALALANAYAEAGLKPDAAAALSVAMKDAAAAELAASEMRLNLSELSNRCTPENLLVPWEGKVSVNEPQDTIGPNLAAPRRISVGENKRVVGCTYEGWQLVSEDTSPVAVRDPQGAIHPIAVDGITRREDTQRQAIFNGGLMIAILPSELVAINLFELKTGQNDPVLWRRQLRSEGSGANFKRQSAATPFGDQVYNYVTSLPGSNNPQSELQLGPIIGETLYLAQGGELIALNVLTNVPRWRNSDVPRDGAVVSDGETVAIVSTKNHAIFKYDCRSGKSLGQEPLAEYRLWATTDDHALLYRDDKATGRREMILQNALTGEALLQHVFTDISEKQQVFGRIVEGTYAVTLATDGQLLIWDLEKAEVLCDTRVDPIAELSELHVLARLDSLVVLPGVAEMPVDAGNVPMVANHGDTHEPAVAAIAIDRRSGQIAWKTNFDKTTWGCTLTQSPISPLVLFSRSRPRGYTTTGSRTKVIDVMAIDIRDGAMIATMDLPVEAFTNDLETRLTVQTPQQHVVVNIGPRTLDYEFK